MRDLPTSQRYSLELLVLFDRICRKHNLKYTLIFNTLWGAIKCKGFLPDAYDAKVAMYHNDYLKFQTICEKELTNTPYYIINNEKDNRIETLTSYLAKKSRVKLSEDRQKDKIFYDYNIEIIPILNCSDKKDIKKFKYLWSVIEARKRPKNFKAKLVSKIKYNLFTKSLLNKNRNDAFNNLKEFLKCEKINTKYVMLGCFMKKNKGIVCLASTYQDLVEMDFEGYKFWAIRYSEKWLYEVYKKNFNMNISKIIPNLFLLKGPEELRRVQLVQLEILKEIDRICRKYNINYFICSGTLLGAIRHKGFIPWDYDADVAMLKTDYDRFLDVADKELDSNKYIARNITTEPTIHITYTQIRRYGTSFIRKGRETNKKANHGILVDIFPVYNGGNNFIKHKIQTKLCMFFKTMFWTHNGANSEKKFLKRQYYKILAKFAPKLSYNAYMKFANMYKEINTNKVAWLVAKNNPYFSEFTNKNNFIDYIDIEFEGHKFKTIKNWNIYLKSIYSDQYNILPNKAHRFNGFIASGFDAGELYPYEEEDSTIKGTYK